MSLCDGQFSRRKLQVGGVKRVIFYLSQGISGDTCPYGADKIGRDLCCEREKNML